jgi:hypothetical protein
MGKKTRKEREEKRETFAVKQKTQKRKNMLIAIGVLLGVAAIVGVSAYNFVNMQSTSLDAPPGAGRLGGEHEHASILVRIFGDKFDFTVPTYQIKSSWIHFEAQDGTTVHRHASGVDLGFLFNSLGITINDQCYIFPDGREFCTDDEYSLKYYINREQMPDISNYVIKEGDRVLISYGNETSAEIEEQLDELDRQEIIA